MNDLRVTRVLLLLSGLVLSSVTHAAGFQGRVLDEAGGPIAGAMVTARFNTPFQERTVFTDDDGHFELSGLPESTDHLIRVRSILRCDRNDPAMHRACRQGVHPNRSGAQRARTVNCGTHRTIDAAPSIAFPAACIGVALMLET